MVGDAISISDRAKQKRHTAAGRVVTLGARSTDPPPLSSSLSAHHGERHHSARRGKRREQRSGAVRWTVESSGERAARVPGGVGRGSAGAGPSPAPAEPHWAARVPAPAAEVSAGSGGAGPGRRRRGSRRRQGRGRGGAKGPREIRRRRVDAPRRGPCCHHGSTRESAGITGDRGCHRGSAGRGRRRWLPWRMERYATICCCLTL